jgi:hypothetical protein
MTETQTRRGRPRGVASLHVMVRMPVDLIAQIDAYAESLQKQIGLIDVTISRGMAIRELVKRGLQSVQVGTPPPQEPRPAAPMAQVPQPPSHLETVDEPEPMAPLSMAAPRAPKAPSPAARPAQSGSRRRPGPSVNAGSPVKRSGK